MSETENLWGDLPTAEGLRTPVFLLREQAEVFTKAYKGVLTGRVSTTRSGVDLNHHLQIVAPALGQYTFGILSVTHGVQIYPAVVINLLTNVSEQTNDEADLKVKVGKILSSAQVHKVIGGLLAQSRDARA